MKLVKECKHIARSTWQRVLNICAGSNLICCVHWQAEYGRLARMLWLHHKPCPGQRAQCLAGAIWAQQGEHYGVARAKRL